MSISLISFVGELSGSTTSRARVLASRSTVSAGASANVVTVNPKTLQLNSVKSTIAAQPRASGRWTETYYSETHNYMVPSANLTIFTMDYLVEQNHTFTFLQIKAIYV